MKNPVHRGVAATIAVLLVFSGDPAALLFAAAIFGAVVSDVLWRPILDAERQARAEAEADAEMYDKQAERYYQRMVEAEGRALAVDIRERAN